jgi:hypothetical protein
MGFKLVFNPLNAELNPICHFLALLGAQHIFHVSRIRVQRLNRSDHACCCAVMNHIEHHLLWASKTLILASEESESDLGMNHIGHHLLWASKSLLLASEESE